MAGDRDVFDAVRLGPKRPLMWVSDEPVTQAAGVWENLFRQRESTHLYPLLLRGFRASDVTLRPWHTGELVYRAGELIDLFDARTALRALWYHLDWPDDPLPEDGLGLGPEEGDDEDDKPDSCPEPAMAGALAGDPDAAAIERAQGLCVTVESPGIDNSGIDYSVVREYLDTPIYLGLVPAARGADALSLCGWTGPVNHAHTEKISALVRSWEDRFGARVVMVEFATLHLSIAAPPVTQEHALAVAAECLAFCPDSIEHGEFVNYATELIGEKSWSFWWD